MEKANPNDTLLQLLTLSSENEQGPIFPSEALLSPILYNNQPLMESGVNLSGENTYQVKQRYYANGTFVRLAQDNGHSPVELRSRATYA